ncbi:YkgJ family cysteine cluster protein [Anaerocolumna sp. AGMB13025]|uniref:YkgJ family cysteine cluster protein n=1 Tax=Anaerocolumna sp. AGMB13025 TaxID=3039116 RepID=UPI00241C4FCF|nr:YkgJ family cysteine cluster protein [Anaerocolumna sp. AGMB13025]WFR58682.1 YkgJ family cysteine cluster protein [Anaerocolumna sp. AGMB13025]
MECRSGCAACCIAPSISSLIPGMPDGKPAGVRCIQLTKDNKCRIFGTKERPIVCGSLKPSKEMCKNNALEAYQYLEELEELTRVKKTND